eukprot:TRINITY_DN9094_c2_g1_i1.p1 TRINITY_DN9094_c2_g1~~TRINITY_DN9094_c2_g1_i1.p1  ORF type:complete len:142 (-),score=3.28 TRINITY_DN9094_c2_g1_i1:39-464(-)
MVGWHHSNEFRFVLALIADFLGSANDPSRITFFQNFSQVFGPIWPNRSDQVLFGFLFLFFYSREREYPPIELYGYYGRRRRGCVWGVFCVSVCEGRWGWESLWASACFSSSSCLFPSSMLLFSVWRKGVKGFFLFTCILTL